MQASEGLFVELDDSEAGVAPGQACVFYESGAAGARILGGGWIARTERAAEAERALDQLIAEVPAAVSA
jgi:tRNA-specific 2-thiouridylase